PDMSSIRRSSWTMMGTRVRSLLQCNACRHACRQIPREREERECRRHYQPEVCKRGRQVERVGEGKIDRAHERTIREALGIEAEDRARHATGAEQKQAL